MDGKTVNKCILYLGSSASSRTCSGHGEKFVAAAARTQGRGLGQEPERLGRIARARRGPTRGAGVRCSAPQKWSSAMAKMPAALLPMLQAHTKGRPRKGAGRGEIVWVGTAGLEEKGQRGWPEEEKRKFSHGGTSPEIKKMRWETRQTVMDLYKQVYLGKENDEGLPLGGTS